MTEEQKPGPLAVLLTLSLVACADAKPEFVAWPALEADLAFTLVLSRNGAVTAGEALEIHLETPRLDTALDDDQVLYLVTLEAAQLARLDPRLRLSPAARVRVVLADPECRAGAIEDDLRRLPLPEAVSRWFELRDGQLVQITAPEAFAPYALEIPRALEAPCRTGPQLRLVPFRESPLAPPGPVVIDGVALDPDNPEDLDAFWCNFETIDMAWLDESRILTGTPCGVLYRHEADRPFPTTPSNRLVIPPPLPPDGTGIWYLSSLAVAPGTSSTGADRVLAGLEKIDSGRNYLAGAIALLRIEPDGQLTSEVFGANFASISGVAIDGTGRFVASADDGRFHLGHIDRGVEATVSTESTRTFGAPFIRSLETADGPVFAMAGEEGEVFALWPEATGGPRLEELSPPQKLSTVRGFTARAHPAGGLELWLGTYSDGLLRRTPDGTWTGVDVPAPPGLDDCAAPIAECGGRDVRDFFNALDFVGADQLLVGLAACSAAVSLDLATSCADIVAPTFEPVSRAERRSRFYLLARSRGGRLASMSRERHLLVLEPSP